MIDDPDDVPSPIDLRDPRDAAAWVAEADTKRPHRRLLRAAFAERVRSIAPARARVLELGPGPGLLAEAILATCDVDAMTLVDFSPPMLAYCRARLGDRARYLLADFKRDDWPAQVDPPFDVVVTMQAVHELRHKRHVPRLYSQIRRLVRAGGSLLVCDHVPPDDGPLHSSVADHHAALAAAGFTRITTVLEIERLYLLSGSV